MSPRLFVLVQADHRRSETQPVNPVGDERLPTLFLQVALDLGANPIE